MKKSLYFAAVCSVAASAGFSQSVTVGTTGAEYTTLKAAVDFVRTDPATPNVITFIDEGPFLQNDRFVLDEHATGPDEMIVQGAPGVRPILIADLETASRRTGMLYLRKEGSLTVRDLILLPPATGVTPENYAVKVPETGIEIQVDDNIGTSITLENILISANNGSNRPTAALDGLTPPVAPTGTVSFRDEGVYLQSQSFLTGQHYLNMTGVVVSGLHGDQGSDGIRGFPDGAVGSEWIIGPGTVLSYNAGHGFQPGGTENFAVKILGEQGNPVKIINNNLNGVSVTDTVGVPEGLTEVEWCIVANNGQHGFNMGDNDTSTEFTNVTIANNGQTALLAPAAANGVTYTFSNVIAAGDGAASDADNVIRLLRTASGTAAPSFFTATNSAIVLAGSYTLNNTAYGGDGIDSNASFTVATPSVVTQDPQFLSLTPSAPGFAVVSNPAYGSAGPGGQPLIGGAGFAPSSVSDWQLF